MLHLCPCHCISFVDSMWHPNLVGTKGKLGSSAKLICKIDQPLVNFRLSNLLCMWTKPSLNSLVKWVIASFFVSQECCVSYSFLYPQELDQDLAHVGTLKHFMEWVKMLWNPVNLHALVLVLDIRENPTLKKFKSYCGYKDMSVLSYTTRRNIRNVLLN